MDNLLRAVFAAAAVVVVSPANAAEIEIANPSFESQVFLDGQENVNDVAGWVGSGSWFHVSNPRDDRFDGTSETSPLPNPIDGVNIVGLNTGTILSQELQAVVQSKGSYKLTLLAGHRRGVPFGTPIVSLIAGGEVLAEAIPSAPEGGKFSTFELTYNAPETGAVIGRPIRIQIRSIGADAQAWFDGVKLSVTSPTPEAGSVAIANNSFEAPELADGAYNINDMPGWVGSGTWWHVSNPNNSWFIGTTTGAAAVNPIDGSNIAGINTGATIAQDLAATLQPGLTYTFSMLVGQRIGVPFGTPKVSLMAGGQVLAEAVPQAPPSGGFAPFQLTFDSPPSGAILGNPLRIQISSSGANAQAWIDNLVLTYAPIAPPPPDPEIVIANHSFESPVQADGQYTINNAPGWIGAGTFHVANPQNNWFGNTSEGSATNPIDGTNIAGINVGGRLYQDLTAVLRPGVTYTLRMLVGQRIGVPFGTPKIRLIAGGQVLAETSPVAPASGSFGQAGLTYDSPETGEVLGQPLRIEITSAGANAQVWIDNVVLTVGPTPPPPPGPDIAIANHSFEQPTLADGQFNINDTPGWVGTGPRFHVANPRNDWFSGTTDGSSVNPIDGSNIGGINVGTTLHQDLQEVVRAGSTYKLTMLVGQRIGTPFGTPTVSLIADGVVLAEATPPAPADGTFAPFELVYVSPDSGDVIGKTLRIQLRSVGASAQAWFDNLKLTVGPIVPPPPPPGPDIAIGNHSFESPALGDGLYTINNTPGWTGSGTWWHVANPRNDWFVGTTGGAGGMSAIDGFNAAGLNTGATLQQELISVVQPGVGYRLSLLVGHRIGVPFGRPTVSLMAGGQVLAEAVPLPPVEGMFAPFELTYNSPDSGGPVGQKLTIRISSTGRDAQVWVDNLKLAVGPKLPPPPSNTAPVAKAVISPLFTVWPDQTNLMVIAVDGESAGVVFDAGQSFDADGDALTYYWSVDDEGSPFANTVIATNALHVGSREITLLVFDGKADNAERLAIEVVDLTEALDEVYGVLIESEILRKDKRPLLATLGAVMEAFNDGNLKAGSRKLQAFQQKVRAQVSEQFPDVAQRLIDAAEQIIAAVETYRSSHHQSSEGGGKDDKK